MDRSAADVIMSGVMKIVIAPQAFKGSISALDAARAMRDGVLRIIPDAVVELVPVADGGDGTLETLVEVSNGEIRTNEITGPLGEQRSAEWGAMGDGTTAVIEMARTSGLALVPLEERNPLTATTYGLGETIRAALDDGFRRFIIGIGGSATNDGGAGMAQALGVSLVDSQGNALPYGGAALSNLHSIDMSGLDSRVRESEFMVACDVNNPLTGPTGASAIYGPQKGASPQMIGELDAALAHFASIVKRDIGADILDVPGSGAAGGLGGGLIAFADGDLRAGVDIVLDTVELDKFLPGSDLVITGEGAIDHSTIYNKSPVGVAARATKLGIPVIAIAGSLGEGFRDVHQHAIDAVMSMMTSPMTLDNASGQAAELLATSVEEALRLMQVGAKVFKNSGPDQLSR